MRIADKNGGCPTLNRERQHCIESLETAWNMLQEASVGAIIPEVQSNLGYALPGSRGIEDIAAFPGRIIRLGSGVAVVSKPDFGASRHIARIILTAIAYDREWRSAMNIRFSEEIIHTCRRLQYDVDSFDRTEEPRDVKLLEGSSLEWGTKRCLFRRHKIPDIIFDRGDFGKEPMVRVLGRNPEEVVTKVIEINHALKRA